MCSTGAHEPVFLSRALQALGALLLGHFHFSSCIIIADLSPLSAFDRKLLEGRAHAGLSVINAHRLFLYRLVQTIHLMST